MIEQPNRFFLDEGLPEQVSNALRLVHYPITGPIRESKRGWKDPKLIPWLAESGLVWITKDDKAKRDHLPDIIKYELSVVWVRGIDRRKNKINPQQLHLMLTVKIPKLTSNYSQAKGAEHYLLYLAGERPILSQRLDPHKLRIKHERSIRTH